MRRENDYFEPEGAGLSIGSHAQPEELRKQKLQAQRMYQQQLEDDRTQKSRMSSGGEKDYESRRYPTNRLRDEPENQYSNYSESEGGLSIGSHQDPTTVRNIKLMAQRAYQQQLEDDLVIKAMSTERKTSGRRRLTAPSESDIPLNSLNIGSYEGSEQEKKRQDAMRIAARNREEAAARMQDTGDSLEKAPRLRSRRLTNEDQDADMYGNGYGQQGRATSRPRGGRDRESDQRTFEDSDNKLMSIGGSGSERGQRRQAAVAIQQQNYDEQMRIQANIPRRDRDADMRVFEEAAYKHIGGGTGGGSGSGGGRRVSGGAPSSLQAGSQSRSSAQAQYVAQLQADAAYKEYAASEELRYRQASGEQPSYNRDRSGRSSEPRMFGER